MQTGILKYPGGHGDQELQHCLPLISNGIVKEVWYQALDTSDIDILFIGGGIPCLKNGKADLDSSFVDQLLKFAASGKYIIGINNGFRLLCELNLLPGRVMQNIKDRFICRFVYMKPQTQQSVMTRGLNVDDVFLVPLATYSGRYDASEADLTDMRQKGQIVFRYSDKEGRITEKVNFPGSAENIAAICNSDKRIFGLIPQPERAFTPGSYNTDGEIIFDTLLKSISDLN